MKKLFFLLVFALSISANLLSQNVNLRYERDFKYPDSLKKMIGMLDIKWALDLGLKKLYLIEYRDWKKIKQEATVQKDRLRIKDGERVYFVNIQSVRKYQVGGLYLDLLPEAASDEQGNTIHTEYYDILELNFYAFKNLGDNTFWILHRGNQVRCDCPSDMMGYTYSDGKPLLMLNNEQLTKAIDLAHWVDKCNIESKKN